LILVRLGLFLIIVAVTCIHQAFYIQLADEVDKKSPPAKGPFSSLFWPRQGKLLASDEAASRPLSAEQIATESLVLAGSRDPELNTIPVLTDMVGFISPLRPHCQRFERRARCQAPDPYRARQRELHRTPLMAVQKMITKQRRKDRRFGKPRLL
jgi:hypothetical protein